MIRGFKKKALTLHVSLPLGVVSVNLDGVGLDS